MEKVRLTGNEILEFYEPLLKSQNRLLADFCRNAEVKPAIFSWWKTHKDLSPKIDFAYKMSVYADITLNELIGIKVDLPDDVLKMEKMLLKIPQEERVMISMIIKNYYDVATEKKIAL